MLIFLDFIILIPLIKVLVTMDLSLSVNEKSPDYHKSW
jgi:hypothetical protein